MTVRTCHLSSYVYIREKQLLGTSTFGMIIIIRSLTYRLIAVNRHVLFMQTVTVIDPITWCHSRLSVFCSCGYFAHKQSMHLDVFKSCQNNRCILTKIKERTEVQTWAECKPRFRLNHRCQCTEFHRWIGLGSLVYVCMSMSRNVGPVIKISGTTSSCWCI